MTTRVFRVQTQIKSPAVSAIVSHPIQLANQVNKTSVIVLSLAGSQEICQAIEAEARLNHL